MTQKETKDKNEEKISFEALEFARQWANENYFYMTNGSGGAVLHHFVKDAPKAINIDGACRDLLITCRQYRFKITIKDAAEILKPTVLQHVHDRCNAPTQPRLFSDMGYLFLNDWRPHKIDHVGRHPENKPPANWVKFMEMLFPIQEEREHVEKWLAVLCNRPDWHLRHGLILRSIDHGVGKDMLLETIIGQCLLGRGNFYGAKLSDITGRFNALLAGKRLVHIRELYRGNSDSADALKQLVTSETIRVEEKYEQPYVSDFYAGFVITSNSERPIILEPDDRRWFVPQVISRYYKDDDSKHSEFFNQLVDGFTTGDDDIQLARYFEWLCVEHFSDAKVFDTFSNRPPVTQGKRDLVRADVKSEQLDEVIDWLDHLKGRYAFRLSTVKEEVGKRRSNVLTENDIKDAFEKCGISNKKLRVGDKTVSCWVHPSMELDYPAAARKLWVSDFDKTFDLERY